MKCATCGRLITRKDIEEKNPEALEAFDRVKEGETWLCSSSCMLGYGLSHKPEDVVDP